MPRHRHSTPMSEPELDMGDDDQHTQPNLTLTDFIGMAREKGNPEVAHSSEDQGGNAYNNNTAIVSVNDCFTNINAFQMAMTHCPMCKTNKPYEQMVLCCGLPNADRCLATDFFTPPCVICKTCFNAGKHKGALADEGYFCKVCVKTKGRIQEAMEFEKSGAIPMNDETQRVNRNMIKAVNERCNLAFHRPMAIPNGLIHNMMDKELKHFWHNLEVERKKNEGIKHRLAAKVEKLERQKANGSGEEELSYQEREEARYKLVSTAEEDNETTEMHSYKEEDGDDDDDDDGNDGDDGDDGDDDNDDDYGGGDDYSRSNKRLRKNDGSSAEVGTNDDYVCPEYLRRKYEKFIGEGKSLTEWKYYLAVKKEKDRISAKKTRLEIKHRLEANDTYVGLLRHLGVDDDDLQGINNGTLQLSTLKGKYSNVQRS